MNDFELFMNFGAVVKIRRCYRDDLYKFVRLMILLGYMRESINWFIFSSRIIEVYNDKGEKLSKEELFELIKSMNKEELLQTLDESYCDDTFWHYVEINDGKTNNICIEYQVGKGFTYGRELDYIRYDTNIKILDVDELISACNMEDEFNLNYVETTFRKELEEKDQELADELDYFCDFYEWTIVKYPNNLWNILDRQTGEFVAWASNTENDNGTFREILERVFYRMTDYFQDEEDIEDLIDEGSFDYVKSKIETFLRLGKQYKFFGDITIKIWEDLLKDCEKQNEEIKKGDE